jgi:hypothetical protein
MMLTWCDAIGEHTDERPVVAKQVAGMVSQQPARDQFVDSSEDQVGCKTGTDVSSECAQLLALRDDVSHPIQILAEFTTGEKAHKSSRMTSFDLQYMGQRMIASNGFKVEANHQAQLLDRVIRARNLLVETNDEAAEDVVENRHQEMLFALEVEIQRAVGDLGLGSDIGHPGGEIPLGGKDLDGGAEDPVSLLLSGRQLAALHAFGHATST